MLDPHSGDIFVFLGNTLSLRDAEKIMPQADFLSPLRPGDITGILLGSPKMIAIIDGIFAESIVDELSDALQRGVKLYGGSATGTLYAAALTNEGMLGFGDIYDIYMAGKLNRHELLSMSAAGAELCSMSEPIVNIKATMAAAVANDALSTEMAALITDAAMALKFSSRTLVRVFQDAAERGIDKNILAQFAEWIHSGGYVDQGKVDACCLLSRIDFELQQHKVALANLEEEFLFRAEV